MASGIIQVIAKESKLSREKVQRTVELLDNNCTVPFIARYRKEITGGLDEREITDIRDMRIKLQELEKRKRSILNSLKKRDLLSSCIKEKIINAPSTQILEDLYLPFRPKKRTKASIAKDKGLEPLAEEIFKQVGVKPEKEARQFIDQNSDFISTEDVLEGVQHIIAEKISENTETRQKIRNLYLKDGSIYTSLNSKKSDPDGKYRPFYNFSELCVSCPPHRILAIFRGEKEKILSVKIRPSEARAIEILEDLFVKSDKEDSQLVKKSIIDSYKRLISPSMERELHNFLKEQADQRSIKTFTKNLYNILMAPPLGQKRILALDPGFRTGCKLACLDEKGNLIHYNTIYPNAPWYDKESSAREIKTLVERFSVEAIAVGNGTAGKETETFLTGLDLQDVIITMVNERGASVYSASDIAREEYPNVDITVRGAVSIGRRLMDPLSELIKIDPKALGVGQYQHDVNQKELQKSLDETVYLCVNRVGVNLNTASTVLLSYVSGLNRSHAENIDNYRKEKGRFNSRKDLLEVPGIGKTVFQQAAGFLRIPDSKNALDSTGVHPEHYRIVESMASERNCSVKDLAGNKDILSDIDLNIYISESVGIPTLSDIVKELKRPGRDPRKVFDSMIFREDINTISDLEKDMILEGIVSNITDFGAFVDIGVHRDGLIHISKMTDSYVRHPSDLLATGQKIKVKVEGIDLERSRISLSLQKVLKKE